MSKKLLKATVLLVKYFAHKKKANIVNLRLGNSKFQRQKSN